MNTIDFYAYVDEITLCGNTVNGMSRCDKCAMGAFDRKCFSSARELIRMGV